MRIALGALVAGLLLGGIVHIAVIFLIPVLATEDAWHRVEAMSAESRFRILPPVLPTEEALPNLDPRMAHAICKLSLRDGAVRILATLPADFWSVAIFDRQGRNIYSLNDGSTDSKQLDVVLITPVRMAQLRRDPPESLETAIIVERRMNEGFVMLRALIADESQTEAIDDALRAATCSPGI